LATVLSAVLFGLAGCNQEEESAGQAAPKEEPPTAVRPEPAEVKPGEDEIAEAKPEAVPEEKPKPVPEPKTEVVPEPPRERWTLAHAGFASKLPQHTDFYADARKLASSSARSSFHQTFSRISRKLLGGTGSVGGMPRASTEYRWVCPQTKPGATIEIVINGIGTLSNTFA
jgi:hypothetical protein